MENFPPPSASNATQTWTSPHLNPLHHYLSYLLPPNSNEVFDMWEYVDADKSSAVKSMCEYQGLPPLKWWRNIRSSCVKGTLATSFIFPWTRHSTVHHTAHRVVTFSQRDKCIVNVFGQIAGRRELFTDQELDCAAEEKICCSCQKDVKQAD